MIASQHWKSYIVVKTCYNQLEVKKIISTNDVFKLENHFRSNSIKAIYNCYFDRFGKLTSCLSLEDLSELEIEDLYRYIDYGLKSRTKMIELRFQYNLNKLNKV